MLQRKIVCPAKNVAKQLPSMCVRAPERILIKALPHNKGVIRLAGTDDKAIDPDRSYSLCVGEEMLYPIRKTDRIWISATNPGDGITIERKKLD